MTNDVQTVNPLTARFTGEGSHVHLELTNAGEQTLRHIEVLTIFLKDEETPGGGPSQVNIKFRDTECLYPKEKVVLTHRTWINGKPVDADFDQLQRLKEIAGKDKPYVLNISWEDADGKSRYQRIPVGH